MTTPVVMTDFTSTIRFDFNMAGQVVAVLANTQTVIQDPQTMEVLATSLARSNMPLEQAQQIIAAARMAPATEVQIPGTIPTNPVAGNI